VTSTVAPRYTFTRDYVSHNAAVWSRLTGALRDKPVVAIEIGSMEGRSAIWWLDNVCTHPNSRLFCIDPGRYIPHFQRLMHNLAQHPRVHQVTMIRDLSRAVLPRFPPVFADLTYVDGSHEARDVLLDALLALPLLKPGGVLIFDDYLHDDPDKALFLPPRAGVDSFLKVAANLVTVEYRGYQLAVRKK
jgi:predicted O-methyltransferase YrrM